MRKGSLADASGSLLFSSFIKPKHDHSHEAHKDGHPEINIQKPVVHISKLNVYHPKSTMSAKEAA